MNKYLAKRIFMNEEGGSPGGGAASPAPALPPASTAAAQPEPAIPVTQLKSVIGEVFGELRNGLFADLRRAGALKKDEPAPTPAPQSAAAAAPAPTGLSMADVEAMLERERVITRVATEHKLTDAQVKRMKGMIAAEKPDDVSGWVSAFVTDMGLVRQTTDQPPTTAPTQLPPSGPPLSDKGSPAPGGVVNWEREFAENPVAMSPAARAAMDAKYGYEKARRMRIDAANAPGGQAERLKVVNR